MAASPSDPFVRAKTLYNMQLSADRTREMRDLLGQASSAGGATPHVSAHMAAATICEYLNHWNDADTAHVETAAKHIQQALAEDPHLALAHYAQGFVHRARGEHQQALDAFTHSLTLNPDFSRAHAQRGAELLYLGHPDQALPEIKKAIELSPRSPIRGMFYWLIGRTYFYTGDYGEAAAWLARSVRSWPHLWYNRAYLIASYAHAGKLSSARRALKSLEEHFPNYTLARVLQNEKSNPNSHPGFVESRDRFHVGLEKAGMPRG